MSNWVGISRYIYLYISFNEQLGGVSRYIYLYISFNEQLGGGFSPDILVYLFQWATGWGVSRYIYLYISFNEHLGGGFSLYILVYLFQWATGWGFLAIYTCISLSMSNWVGVSCQIYLYISFNEQLGGGFSPDILVYLFQWATGWGFLARYTCISLSMSNWVGVSRYIYLYISFNEQLGGGFSLYILYISFNEQLGGSFSLYILVYLFQWATGWGFSLYILVYLFQWATGWGFLAIYTCISLSMSNWVGISRYIYLNISFNEQLGGVSRYIYLYISFNEQLGGGFSLYILAIYNVIFNDTLNTFYLWLYGVIRGDNAREREMFYLTTLSTHFIYGYMESKEETMREREKCFI